VQGSRFGARASARGRGRPPHSAAAGAQRRVRDARAGYVQSLDVLRAAKAEGVYTKSSLMLGLGETDDEVIDAMLDLRAAGGCSLSLLVHCLLFACMGRAACISGVTNAPQWGRPRKVAPSLRPLVRHRQAAAAVAQWLIGARRARARAGVDILTFGQYLQPTPAHLDVAEYVTPEAFERWRRYGEDVIGFRCGCGAPTLARHARPRVRRRLASAALLRKLRAALSGKACQGAAPLSSCLDAGQPHWSVALCSIA